MNNIITSKKRPFSLAIYLLIIFGLSWPFLITAGLWIWAKNATYVVMFNSTAMIMVTVGTFIAGRYVFKDGFKDAGWRWGKPIHYVLVIALALLLFFAPLLIDLSRSSASLLPGFTWIQLIWMMVVYSVAIMIPGFGEEFGFRGYLLPHLARRMTPRKAVAVQGVIYWVWHLPYTIIVGIVSGMRLGGGDVAVVTSIVLLSVLFSALPGIFDGVLFAYIWSRSGSLAVVTVFHGLFDGIRNATLEAAGTYPLFSLWPPAVIIILGAVLLWRGSWKTLQKLITSTKLTG